MKVNFNNVRLSAVRDISKVVKQINVFYKEAEKQKAESWDRKIPAADVIEKLEEIGEAMNDVRGSIVTIACTYLENDPDMRDLSDEIGEVPFFGKDEDEADEEGDSDED